VGERRVTIRRGNDDLHLSLTESVMRDPAGTVAGRIFTFRDISKEHVVEQMKSQFVSTVSHQLRGPLTSIYGFAETLRRRWEYFADSERIRFLDYISDAADRLSVIVDQLLNVARLEGGDLPMEAAPTDVRAVVEDVVANAEQEVGAGTHTFVVEVPDGPLSALADPEKLRQILGHLVDNAVKFSPAGGVVRVAAEQDDGVVVLSVADQGIGIPPGEQERIFTKFYRREEGGGGTGLGLFLAQGLVERMGGHIRVESTEGEGSTFVVELPAASTPEPALPEEQEVAR
jgi:signal transduction histidine kinase